MLRNTFLKVLCVVCAITCYLPVFAQEADSLHYELNEVVVRSSVRVQPETSVVPLQRMERSDVTYYGLQSLSDALKMMPGVQVQDYGGVGGLKTVSVRGLGAKHTSVSYDGMVVSDAQSGMVDLGRFHMENVNCVEMTIGQGVELLPRPARHYSLSSLVSLNSTYPSSAGLSSSVKIKGGSFGMAGFSANGSFADDDADFALSLSGNYMRSDGMYPFTLLNGVHSSQEKRRDSDVESFVLEGNLWADVYAGSLKAKIYYYDSERGLPGAVNLYNKDNRERLWNRNLFVQAGYDVCLPDELRMSVVAKYDRNYSRYKEVNKNYASGEQVDVNRQNEYYLSLAVADSGTEGFGWSAAADVAYATLDNNFENGKSPRRLSFYTAVSARYVGYGITVVGSLLATYIKDEARHGSPSSPFKRMSPALSVSIQPFKGVDLMFRASVKDSYRLPTFTDLYYLRLGNIALKPERATQCNVGVTWYCGFDFCGVVNSVAVTADTYYNNVRDKIVALPTMYIWRMMNFGKADISGADISVSLRSMFSKELGIRSDIAYSWLYAVDVTDKSAKNYRHQLPYTPEYSGNFSLVFENPIVDVTYMFTAVGERYMLPQNTARNRMSGYVEHSFVLNKDFGFGDTKLHLQGKLTNIGNEQYEVIRYYPMPGFSWSLSASLLF